MNITTTKQSFSLAPQTFDEALRFAEVMSKSNIVPKDYQGNPGNILVAVQWGMEIGLQPLQAMQNIAVINGRPSIWGDSMLALVQGSGLMEYINETQSDSGCVCVVKRKGLPETIREFSVEDAKKAGLWNKSGPWANYPKRMMQMRARAFALRDTFADVLRGMAMAEEALDMPAEKNMGPAEVVQQTQQPSSKTESVKAKLAAKKAQQALTLDQVIASFELASNLQELAKAGENASKLASEDEKHEAREAYKTRLAALSKPENPHQDFLDQMDSTESNSIPE
jgi:hypothetical protein